MVDGSSAAAAVLVILTVIFEQLFKQTSVVLPAPVENNGSGTNWINATTTITIITGGAIIFCCLTRRQNWNKNLITRAQLFLSGQPIPAGPSGPADHMDTEENGPHTEPPLNIIWQRKNRTRSGKIYNNLQEKL